MVTLKILELMFLIDELQKGDCNILKQNSMTIDTYFNTKLQHIIMKLQRL